MIFCLLNFRRVTCMFDLGECLWPDADNLPSIVNISPAQTPEWGPAVAGPTFIYCLAKFVRFLAFFFYKTCKMSSAILVNEVHYVNSSSKTCKYHVVPVKRRKRTKVGEIYDLSNFVPNSNMLQFTCVFVFSQNNYTTNFKTKKSIFNCFKTQTLTSCGHFMFVRMGIR